MGRSRLGGLLPAGRQLGGQLGVGDGVDLSDNFFGMPGHLDLTMGVTGTQQAQQFVFPAFVETFVGLGQQSPDPIKRILFAASMTKGLMLDPAAALVELVVGPDELGGTDRRPG